MARYYAMVALLAAVSSLFFWRLLRGGSRKSLVGYVVASLVLAYTNYLALCLVASQLVVGLLRGPRRVLWVVAGAGLALGYAPWLGVVLPQAETLAHRGEVADAVSGLGGAATRLAYPLYVFALGETVFPWRLHVVVPALVLVGVVTGAGLVRSRHLSLASGILIPLSLGLSWVVVSTVARTVPPVYLPSRMLFLTPVLVVVFALGIRQLGKWGVVAGLATLGIWCYSIGNYYRGNDFHNPVYLIPWRVVVTQLKSSMHAGDQVVATPEYPFLFYKGDDVEVTLLSAETLSAVKNKLTTRRPPRLWVLTRERADPTVAVALRRFLSWLNQWYGQVETHRYTIEDPRAVELKKALLQRPVSASKVSLTLYVNRSR
jgi:hypothetical protein